MTTVQTVKVLAGRGIRGKYKIEVNPNATSSTRIEGDEVIYQLKDNKFSELSGLIRDANVGSSMEQVFDEMRVLLGEGVVITSPNAEIPSGDFKLFITQKDGKQGIDFDEEFESLHNRFSDVEDTLSVLNGKINTIITLLKDTTSKNASSVLEIKVAQPVNTSNGLSKEDLDDLEILKKL
jgi:hypothetical protein